MAGSSGIQVRCFRERRATAQDRARLATPIGFLRGSVRMRCPVQLPTLATLQASDLGTEDVQSRRALLGKVRFRHRGPVWARMTGALYPRGYGSMRVVKIEASTVDDVVKRLRRVEGQLGGLVRMIEEGRDCEDVITQLAAASKALDRAGFKIVASGMRQCVDDQAGRTMSEMDVARMERLFLSLA